MQLKSTQVIDYNFKNIKRSFNYINTLTLQITEQIVSPTVLILSAVLFLRAHFLQLVINQEPVVRTLSLV